MISENLRLGDGSHCALSIDMRVDNLQSTLKKPDVYYVRCAVPVLLELFKRLDDNYSRKLP
jgi:hypothetical protein